MANEIRLAYSDIDTIRTLFREYAATLGVDLGFQNFDKELEGLPGEYALPRGRLYLALYAGQPAGCVALRPRGEKSCEMKRLFVKPDYRGLRIGRALAERAITEARAMRYEYIVLDTLAQLERSMVLYDKLGFKETKPYYDNPHPEAQFLRLDLTA